LGNRVASFTELRRRLAVGAGTCMCPCNLWADHGGHEGDWQGR
jgi:hypothetical protein